MTDKSDLITYYRERAGEYEKVYAKPERQADLSDLQARVPEWFANRRVLEVACGTGYWTRLIAARATTVVACDLAPEVLDIARARQPRTAPTDFVMGDAFALDRIPGEFDAGFVGFLWSHILRADIPRFLAGLHRRLSPGSRVLILDNRYLAGSNWPVTRTDPDGNSYQRRILDNGSEYEVLKNFPRPAAVRDAIASVGALDLSIRELRFYWYACYTTR
jgi:demethylmenaquinone methyltransferase/2-methoxy-6-polyprenyl-1,4-benzoquinol methylase